MGGYGLRGLGVLGFGGIGVSECMGVMVWDFLWNPKTGNPKNIVGIEE